MVMNSDGSVYIAQTSSEVLVRQTDHTSYSGMVGDIASRLESGFFSPLYNYLILSFF